jgi:D-serine dehydratase
MRRRNVERNSTLAELAAEPLIDGQVTVRVSRLLPSTKYLRRLESIRVELETAAADMTFLVGVEKSHTSTLIAVG